MCGDSPTLKKRFITWCVHHGARETAASELWIQLSDLYREAHRRYHHLGHIQASLDEFDATGSDNSLIEGAIWFHDVIYDPKRGDNEAASVAWFLDATSPWLDPQSTAAITRLIEATDFRLPPSDDPDSQLMVDIDLAILSASPEAYAKYCRAIRQEYAHVSDEAFRKGRAKVMAGFLEGPIYRTVWFRGREERARANIQAELECLSVAVSESSPGIPDDDNQGFAEALRRSEEMDREPGVCLSHEEFLAAIRRGA
jgi:predicted metal-dependent HD superfamily phosphohydrolase